MGVDAVAGADVANVDIDGPGNAGKARIGGRGPIRTILLCGGKCGGVDRRVAQAAVDDAGQFFDVRQAPAGLGFGLRQRLLVRKAAGGASASVAAPGLPFAATAPGQAGLAVGHLCPIGRNGVRLCEYGGCQQQASGGDEPFSGGVHGRSP